MLSKRADNIAGWIAIAILFGILFVGNSRSQEPPQTPRVETNQQSNRPGEPGRSVAGVAAIPADPTVNLKKESGNCCAHGAEETSEFWPFRLWGHRLKITDSLLALFTFLLVILAAWQGFQLKRTVDSAEKSDRLLERAYVTGGPGRRTTDGKTDTHYGIVFTGMNTGKTPAFTKEIFWGICKKAEWEAKQHQWPNILDCEHREWEEVLNPQMGRGDIIEAPFAKTEVIGDEEHVCYGKIIYADIFGAVYATSWKHSVTREGPYLKTVALPGCYSQEWENQKKRKR
jgi:hypothetical protein